MSVYRFYSVDQLTYQADHTLFYLESRDSTRVLDYSVSGSFAFRQPSTRDPSVNRT
jgi:hypothetical protein